MKPSKKLLIACACFVPMLIHGAISTSYSALIYLLFAGGVYLVATTGIDLSIKDE